MQLIGDSADDASDAFLALGRGDGDDGDEVFAVHVGVREGPFVVLADRLQERFLRHGAAEDLVSDAGAGHYEVG